ncbi:DoxX family protein [Streptomyces viridiviolaceus]|uniref:DoxX family protein n=1 Tax=Streptomyces viridiviolaceus TaxID=68282 RepID=UPI003570E740
MPFLRRPRRRGNEVPSWLGMLVCWAAMGLAVTMLGAAVVHGRRREFPMIGANLVLIVLCVAVGWGRFGHHTF